MASVSTLPRDELTCAVCHDIYFDPIILSCSHSFCRVCLQRCWRQPIVSTAARPGFSRRQQQQVERKCPVCRSVNATSVPPNNLALRNLCQAFLEEEERRARPGFLCPQHGEKRKLYCMDDKEPMCVVCQTSKRHRTHKCCPVDEVAHDYKEELRRALTPLKQKLDVFIQIRKKCTETERYMKEQAKNTEKLIREEINRFREFLQDEEETRIAALKREEAQKSLLIKDQIDGLSKAMTTLKDKIDAIEMELKAEDIFFLDNYKTTVERAQCTLQEPKMVSESLIDVSKHLGNLAFKIWEKMEYLAVFFPVILDPNTASPHLILERGLNGVKGCERIENLPDNPERPHSRLCVLGSEGFDSGTHSWEMAVGVETYWEIGVTTKHDKINVRPHTGSWMICHLNGKYIAQTPMSEAPHTRVKVSQRPRGIRVQLDLGSGQLSFSDCETNEHLHTFRIGYRFTERLFPFISWTSDLYTARVMPLDVSVSVKKIGLRMSSV